MSGILGTNFSGAHWRDCADRSAAVARARAARDMLSHRGADFAGDWYDDRLYLGHTEQGQLDSSVIGRLPLAAGDGSVTITLDGYISNSRELRTELGKTHAFHSNGGSEVVLQAYLQWGLEGMLRRLRGGFALAIYDRANARLCLVRDALGTKPLYYLHQEPSGSLMFASELKGIEALADESLLTTDQTAVYDYLTYRYIPAPKTLYAQVRKLAAGQCLSIDLATGHSSLQRFWEPPEADASRYGSSEEFVEHGRELLNTAIESRTFGLSAVGGMCQPSTGFADWLKACQPQVQPLSFAVEPVAGEQAQDSSVLAYQLRGQFDEPFADIGFGAREGLLQTLSGSTGCAVTDVGAQVVFGTAARYVRAGRGNLGTVGWLKSKLGTNSNRNRGADASMSVIDAFHGYARALGGLAGPDKAKQGAAWEIPSDYNDYWYFQQFYRADLPRTLRFQHLDLQTLVPEHQLTQLDRQALRYGIEARTPLLDQDLVSWLVSAPAQLRGPQFDVQSALFGTTAVGRPMLDRLKQSFKGAAQLLPGGKSGVDNLTPGTLALLQQRFPELDYG